MKAKMSKNGVELIYQVKKGEHPHFLEMLGKYKKAGVEFQHYDGGNTTDSWIKSKCYV